MRALAIAHNTFREARRDKFLWIVAVYAGIVIGGAYFLSPLALGEGYRVTRDLGLAALSLIGLVLVALVGGGMVQKEIDRRTILIVLSRPLGRSEFIVGKYLGLLTMMALVFVAMVLILVTVLWSREGRVEPAVLWAAAFTFGEFMVMTGVVVLFSTFVTPVLSGVFSLALFVFGHFAGDLLAFADRAPSVATAWMAKAMYYALPHLESFNLRPEAVYGVIPEPGRVIAAVLYAVLYTAALLALGSAILSRREFR